MKMKAMYLMVVALVMVAFVGCSDKDDPAPSGGSIDAVLGNYKGTIKIIGGAEVFDQTLVITKVNDKKVKVTAQNTSLNLPVRELEVINNMNISIQAVATEPQGSLIYTFENKGLMFVAERTAEGQLEYSFNGTKQ
ncbi:hypothetical protein [Sphingobacterium spiritivorum]|uniref:Lipocalin-like domain-containing protein n=1 Tax=Sphingobacterium spiritivorum ATCC 33861 TaxID=525373 RepID=D7VP91_SPHSI|nr:hypothetical protein [Sphingobacterium spiritivorum]EFK57738.1 hypothetical protein HMPREF0766_12811 [Sphingobacterium spiritivorum ATCC 33861]QQT36229.1 hypothetical protein I6J01_02020 [Sphingobacterium spiritivorum]WQD32966.1 hypothetical protein U0038_15715 [Sphingobacterium spiritivorum]SUJ17415.1 Uncharacterised protein [Sphingobacterium spiritivorum]